MCGPTARRTIDEFDDAGGTAALMTQLSPLLDLDTPTVTGTLRDRLGPDKVLDAEVVRPLDRPLGTEPTIVIVRGSLAPEGAIIKRAVVDTRAEVLRGQGDRLPLTRGGARRLARREDPARTRGGSERRRAQGRARHDLHLGVHLRRGGRGLAGSVAVISDAQLSGLVNKCMVVGEIAPEAAIGGPLAFVQDGDRITIDVDKRSVDLDVPAEELASRTPWSRPADPELKHSWLGIYADEVGPSGSGLTFSTRAGG